MGADAKVDEIRRMIESGASTEAIEARVHELAQAHAQRCPGCGEPMLVGKAAVIDGQRTFVCLPCTGCPCNHCARIRALRSMN